ncbi:MAG: beta-ketoacyl-[acyl-carrier-protein] synthase family protein [Acidobacteriota bacterium]
MPTLSADPRWPDATVAVTGLGAVTAWGWGVNAFLRGLDTGRTTIGPPRTFDVTGHRTGVASEVGEPPPDGPWRDLAGWGEGSRCDRFALAAAVEAWSGAGLRPGDAARAGLYFGGSTAAMAEGEAFFQDLGAGGHPRVAPLASHPLDGPANAVARALRLGGPVVALSSACASGGLAVAEAVDALRAGDVEVALAGGADALCQLTYAGFNALRAVDEKPCRPFRADRGGMSLGEGAGMLVLETVAHARARGARIRAVVLGRGASCDAHHMTAPHPEGEGAARAVSAALGDAGLDPGRGGFVNAHGTGTPHNDRAEARALASVFGDGRGSLPVTSTKGVVGHLLGGSGAIEAVATALCLERGRVHGVPGDPADGADPEAPVDLVLGGSRVVERTVAVSTSLAFGGSNVALVLAGPEPRAEGGSGS